MSYLHWKLEFSLKKRIFPEKLYFPWKVGGLCVKPSWWHNGQCGVARRSRRCLWLAHSPNERQLMNVKSQNYNVNPVRQVLDRQACKQTGKPASMQASKQGVNLQALWLCYDTFWLYKINRPIGQCPIKKKIFMNLNYRNLHNHLWFRPKTHTSYL